jgi:hypothetical protein
MAHGEIAADDLVRMEGSDIEITVTQLLGLALLGKVPRTSTTRESPDRSALPDWLEDAVRYEAGEQRRAPVVLDWLDDVRQGETARANGRQQNTLLGETALDWLADIREIEATQLRGKDLEGAQILDSVAEAFLDAHRALQNWVDDPANRPLIASGDLEPIRRCAAVQQLLARYEIYGPVMLERLYKRLAFLVEDRKKLLGAFA